MYIFFLPGKLRLECAKYNTVTVYPMYRFGILYRDILF